MAAPKRKPADADGSRQRRAPLQDQPSLVVMAAVAAAMPATTVAATAATATAVTAAMAAIAGVGHRRRAQPP